MAVSVVLLPQSAWATTTPEPTPTVTETVTSTATVTATVTESVVSGVSVDSFGPQVQEYVVGFGVAAAVLVFVAAASLGYSLARGGFR